MPSDKSETLPVHTQPQKEFFVSMITRDITTRSCVLDLIDNAVDGAMRPLTRRKKSDPYRIDLTLSSSSFTIEDNCGGISVETATDYAFHFGRRKDSKPVKDGIGMYGIGMKRAIFKLGRLISIESSTLSDGFDMTIDIDKWLKQPDTHWDFTLQTRMKSPHAGTKIEVKKLNPGIGDELDDNFFVTDIKRVIAKVYSTFLLDDLTIRVNNTAVTPYRFELRESAKFKPIRKSFMVGKVKVELTAGLGGLPPEDDSPEFKVPEAEHYGWYVLGNGRVVLPGDKTVRTGWGHDGAQVWHSQYNGFLGVVEFTADNPSDLPWTTTKADVDEGAPVYRQALSEMKKAAQEYIDYTTMRRGDLDRARKLEGETKPRALKDVAKNQTMTVPVLSPSPRVEMTTVSYQEPKARVVRAAKALGSAKMPAKTIGQKTFDYYYRSEVEE